MFNLFKYISFFIGAERTQNLSVGLMRLVENIPFIQWILGKIYRETSPALQRDVFGISFRNPIGVAAGFDRNAEIFNTLGNLGFGFVEIGTVTPRPQPGNAKPRVFMLPDDSAILNRVGFESNGMEQVVLNLRRKHPGVVIGCNIGKNSTTSPELAPKDYLRVFRNLYQYADYFSVNICYNTSSKPYIPNTREELLAILNPLFEFRRGQTEYRPVLLKISPDLTDEQIDLMTDIMLETPLDGIVATNATAARNGLNTDAALLNDYGIGAISGGALTNRSLEVVKRIHERSQGTYPIIGVGGIMTPDDAKRMLAAGATLIQVYSAVIYNGPSFASKVCKSIIQDVKDNSHDSIDNNNR